ncbi:hypothetical protein [Microbacterium sp. CIAB417]|uniref:hypothetical protein n=1 Tax=Microbacterium sp. CIAB417 TaxID=2860287 RepID=UPI001FAD4974|nr:hypothetical protein [Microbacterium sp. CIAB417]
MSIIHEPLNWKQADDDVHVATRGGEFAGFVEFDGRAHLVRDNHGTEVGSFPTLADARRALEGAGRSTKHPLRLTLRRRLRRARA